MAHADHNGLPLRPEPEEGLATPDLRERGGLKDGVPQTLDRRLFMQFQAFGNCRDSANLVGALEGQDFPAVVYDDVNDPRGVGFLTYHEDPLVIAGPVRHFLNNGPFASLTTKPEYTMLGRTYALGYEPDLADVLLRRPVRYVQNPDWPWAVWYPLRRSGAFARLPDEEKRAVLKEHGTIGFAFGRADLVHDVRLACHGLDKRDNDFVIGLVGRELFPLSAVVETMRGTRQTAEFLDRLGPFFVGRVAGRHAGTSAASHAAIADTESL